MAEAKPRLTVAREWRVDANRRVSNRGRETQGRTKTEGKDELALRFVPQAGLAS
jgi:hypothetical protein